MGALAAELIIRPARTTRREQLVAGCAVINAGDETVRISRAPLSSPSLCLEIVDQSAAPVLLPPPPVPGNGDDLLGLAPGERYAVEHGAFLPSWTPAGRFRARLRYVSGSRLGVEKWDGELFSDWAEFEVAET